MNRVVNLISKFDISKGGSGTFVFLGDLSGNGRIDFLTAQPDSMYDDRYFPHQIQALTAYDIKGNILWQKGEPAENTKVAGSDIPVQIYDIDGDGYNEVLCVMDKKFKVLDGRNGETKKEFDLPNEWAHDCIIIANLTGGDYPSDIILKNRYNQMWAVDKDFNLLWTHRGNMGHFPWIYDFNNDGFDEVMAGYTMLDRYGKELWSCHDLDDHCDALWVGKVKKDLHGVQMVIGGSVTVMYDTDGNEIWRYTGSKESQHVALGRYNPDSDEVLVAGLDRVVRGGPNAEDALFVLNSDGIEIAREKRDTIGWLTIIHTVNNYFDDNQDYILAFRRGGGIMPTLYNHKLEPVVSFPKDGYVLVADIFNENKDDIIIYSDGELAVYSSCMSDIDKPADGKPLKQTKRLSHQTVYYGAQMPEI